MFMSLFLFFSMLLLCSFFRLKELFQVKNGLTTSLLFFLKIRKIWVGRTTLNGEKKRIACLLITTALPGKFNIFVYQLSSTPINCSRRTTTALQGKLT